MPFFMIQVIHRALNIMEYIATDPDRPKELGDIAEDLKLHAATCANIIKTLVTRQYLVKLEKQKGYLLGPMFYRMGVMTVEAKAAAGAAPKRAIATGSGR
jgi:DNA-binding IclR family transcriptional regulator